jgi:hypothetical protein
VLNHPGKEEDGREYGIRDTLFGDMPLSMWPEGDNPSAGEPWDAFVAAREDLASGREAQAIERLEALVETPGLESRHTLQAWHFLRQLGVAPPDGEAKDVYGVVVEVTLEEGTDIVAAYVDHTARYFNYGGGAVIWESPDDSLDAAIDDLLGAGERIIRRIGPWNEARPPAPPRGQARLSMLTPSGLHFGQAPFDVLMGDEMGGPILAAATRLMRALIEKSRGAAA